MERGGSTPRGLAEEEVALGRHPFSAVVGVANICPRWLQYWIDSLSSLEGVSGERDKEVRMVSSFNDFASFLWVSVELA